MWKKRIHCSIIVKKHSNQRGTKRWCHHLSVLREPCPELATLEQKNTRYALVPCRQVVLYRQEDRMVPVCCVLQSVLEQRGIEPRPRNTSFIPCLQMVVSMGNTRATECYGVSACITDCPRSLVAPSQINSSESSSCGLSRRWCC